MEQNGKVFNLGSLLFKGILSLGSFLYKYVTKGRTEKMDKVRANNTKIIMKLN